MDAEEELVDAFKEFDEEVYSRVRAPELVSDEETVEHMIKFLQRLPKSFETAINQSEDLTKEQKDYLSNKTSNLESIKLETVINKVIKSQNTPLDSINDLNVPLFDADVFNELTEVVAGMPGFEEYDEIFNRLRLMSLAYEYSDLVHMQERNVDFITNQTIKAKMELDALEAYEKIMTATVESYLDISSETDLDLLKRQTFTKYVKPYLLANKQALKDGTTADALALLFGVQDAETLVSEHLGQATIQTEYVSESVANALQGEMIAFLHNAFYQQDFLQSAKDFNDLFAAEPGQCFYTTVTSTLVKAFVKGISGKDPVLFVKTEGNQCFIPVNFGISYSGEEKNAEKKPLPKKVKGGEGGISPDKKREREKETDIFDDTDAVDQPSRKRRTRLSVNAKAGSSRDAPEEEEEEYRNFGVSQDHFELMFRWAIERFGGIVDQILEMFGIHDEAKESFVLVLKKIYALAQGFVEQHEKLLEIDLDESIGMFFSGGSLPFLGRSLFPGINATLSNAFKRTIQPFKALARRVYGATGAVASAFMDEIDRAQQLADDNPMKVLALKVTTSVLMYMYVPYGSLALTGAFFVKDLVQMFMINRVNNPTATITRLGINAVTLASLNAVAGDPLHMTNCFTALGAHDIAAILPQIGMGVLAIRSTFNLFNSALAVYKLGEKYFGKTRVRIITGFLAIYLAATYRAFIVANIRAYFDEPRVIQKTVQQVVETVQEQATTQEIVVNVQEVRDPNLYDLFKTFLGYESTAGTPLTLQETLEKFGKAEAALQPTCPRDPFGGLFEEACAPDERFALSFYEKFIRFWNFSWQEADVESRQKQIDDAIRASNDLLSETPNVLNAALYPLWQYAMVGQSQRLFGQIRLNDPSRSRVGNVLRFGLAAAGVGLTFYAGYAIAQEYNAIPEIPAELISQIINNFASILQTLGTQSGIFSRIFEYTSLATTTIRTGVQSLRYTQSLFAAIGNSSDVLIPSVVSAIIAQFILGQIEPAPPRRTRRQSTRPPSTTPPAAPPLPSGQANTQNLPPDEFLIMEIQRIYLGGGVIRENETQIQVDNRERRMELLADNIIQSRNQSITQAATDLGVQTLAERREKRLKYLRFKREGETLERLIVKPGDIESRLGQNPTGLETLEALLEHKREQKAKKEAFERDHPEVAAVPVLSLGQLAQALKMRFALEQLVVGAPVAPELEIYRDQARRIYEERELSPGERRRYEDLSDLYSSVDEIVNELDYLVDYNQVFDEVPYNQKERQEANSRLKGVYGYYVVTPPSTQEVIVEDRFTGKRTPLKGAKELLDIYADIAEENVRRMREAEEKRRASSSSSSKGKETVDDPLGLALKLV